MKIERVSKVKFTVYLIAVFPGEKRRRRKRLPKGGSFFHRGLRFQVKKRLSWTFSINLEICNPVAVAENDQSPGASPKESVTESRTRAAKGALFYSSVKLESPGCGIKTCFLS